MFPPAVEIRDIEDNTLYVMTLSIQNVAFKPYRVRIDAPKNPCFQVEYDRSKELAPGMEMKCDVKFQVLDEFKSQTSKLIVRCGEFAGGKAVRGGREGREFKGKET